MTHSSSGRGSGRAALVAAIVAAIVGAGVSALLVNIFERKEEARRPFAEVVEMSKAIMPSVPVEPRSGGVETGNQPFDVQFVVVGAPPGAQAAINACESYLETTFARTRLALPIVVNVSFGDLGTSTLGSTGPAVADIAFDDDTRLKGDQGDNGLFFAGYIWFGDELDIDDFGDGWWWW